VEAARSVERRSTGIFDRICFVDSIPLLMNKLCHSHNLMYRGLLQPKESIPIINTKILAKFVETMPHKTSEVGPVPPPPVPAPDKLQRPADKLKAIRAAAQAEADQLKSQIAALKVSTIAKYIDSVEELGEGEVAAKLDAIDADIERAAVPALGSDTEVLGGALAPADTEVLRGALAPAPSLPKVLRDYTARMSALAAQLARAEHAADHAEAAAINERSDTVAAVVVDYHAPGNGTEVDVKAEVRAARHVLEHVVLTQDGHIDVMRAQLNALEAGGRSRHEELVALVASLAAEVKGLREELHARPLVVPLKDHADAATCRRAGYSVKDLLQAGFDIKSLCVAGFTARDLRVAGAEWQEICDGGATCKGLLDIVEGTRIIDFDELARIWGLTRKSSKDDFERVGLGAKSLAGVLTGKELRAIYAFSSPTEAKKLGLSLADLAGKGHGWNLLQYCSTGDANGVPFSAKELLSSTLINQPYHTNLSQWNGNWQNHEV